MSSEVNTTYSLVAFSGNGGTSFTVYIYAKTPTEAKQRSFELAKSLVGSAGLYDKFSLYSKKEEDETHKLVKSFQIKIEIEDL